MFDNFFGELEADDHDGYDEYDLCDGYTDNIYALTPTEFIERTNETLRYELGETEIKGEVANFKINQKRWVFFDLKDEKSSVNCFMPVWDLKIPLEDGMKVLLRGMPKVTKLGKFSVTVKKIVPMGEGNLKKAYEFLKKKLEKEGLFSPLNKRVLPENLTRIGVISSTQAAGYADFVKILNARWGGIEIQVAHTQVQGLDAPDQILRALNYFNERGEVEVIAVLRGGGSADDLACFNDERLTRAVASSKIPVITGIGHEVDETLCDLAADKRASTPSNAAEILTPINRANAKSAIMRKMQEIERDMVRRAENEAQNMGELVRKAGRDMVEKVNAICTDKMTQVTMRLNDEVEKKENEVSGKMRLLEALSPEKVLRRGYAILSGKITPGNVVKITTFEKEITAEVKKIKERS